MKIDFKDLRPVTRELEQNLPGKKGCMPTRTNIINKDINAVDINSMWAD